LDRLRKALRSRHYSRRTEQAYCHWVKRFIFFHNVRHTAEMAEPEINAFLTHLAIKGKVSASTQNQALSALLFLYRYVLDRPLGRLGGVVRARKPHRLPVVLTRHEIRAILGRLAGDHWLMASLMNGAGLRLAECLRLRVQDIDLFAGRLHQLASCSSIMGKGMNSLVFTGPRHLVETFLDDLPESEMPDAVVETGKVVGKAILALMTVPLFRILSEK
jgi:site-specific recombinase XerD